MTEITREQAHQAWRAAETLKRLSDRLIALGPFGLGLDGITAVIPVAGTVYSAAAGAFLMWHGVRAGAPAVTLARMLAYLAIDTIASDIPVVGQAADVFFQGHLMAANALQKDIVRRFGAPEETLRPVGSGSTAGKASGAQPA